MATSHNFAILASHSVRQPINPKTGLAFATYERKGYAEKTGGVERNDEQRTNGSSLRTSLGTGALTSFDSKISVCASDGFLCNKMTAV